MEDAVISFLSESNHIEDVWDAKSLEDAIAAWKYIITQDELTLENIQETHKILMRRQPLKDSEKGFLRTVRVFVGTKEGVAPRLVKRCLQDWLPIANADPKTYEFPQEFIKQCHVQYENIHPFVDGNGRTGRIFMNWQRQRAKMPILVIKEKEKYEYYRWFK